MATLSFLKMPGVPPPLPNNIKLMFILALEGARMVDLLRPAPTIREMLLAGLEWTRLDPVALTVLGLVHALAFHAPSIWCIKTIHRGQCLALLEHIVYMFMAHAGSLSIIETVSGRISDDAATESPVSTLPWAVSAYLAMHYTWHVYAATHLRAQGTLSPGWLKCSMVIFGSVTMPLVMGCVSRMHGGRVPNISFAHHFVAYVISDCITWGATFASTLAELRSDEARRHAAFGAPEAF